MTAFGQTWFGLGQYHIWPKLTGRIWPSSCRRHASTPNRSGCSSCAVCGSHCLYNRVPAGVAVPSTSLATTAQRAQMQGFWVAVNVAARVCWEAGGRVRTNLAVRDMDLGAHNHLDGRRLEIVVDGLPLWGGSQLAVDTTMVSPLTREGVAHRGTATTNGKSLARARRRKESTYPELTGEHGRSRLVVMGVEVGGRWSTETSVFLRCLAAAKARGSPPWIEGQVCAAWLSRWQGLLGCAAARHSAVPSWMDQQPQELMERFHL